MDSKFSSRTIPSLVNRYRLGIMSEGHKLRLERELAAEPTINRFLA